MTPSVLLKTTPLSHYDHTSIPLSPSFEVSIFLVKNVLYTCTYNDYTHFSLRVLRWQLSTKMPSRARALRDKNRAKKIIKLSESHIDKSLDTECEERDSFFEAAHQ